MMRRGSLLMPMNFITPSVHHIFAIHRVLARIQHLARLWLIITTRSEPSLVAVIESRGLLDRHSKRIEESRRDSTKARAIILCRRRVLRPAPRK